MGATNENIKLTFTEQAVKEYAGEVVRAMERTIRQKRVIDTTELVNSLSYNTQGTDKGAVGKLLFKEYGRYIDMGVSRGRKLGEGVRGLDKVIQSTQKPKTNGKPRKIYSPIAYGKLNGLIGDLMYGLTEQTIEIIKTNLENANQNI